MMISWLTGSPDPPADAEPTERAGRGQLALVVAAGLITGDRLGAVGVPDVADEPEQLVRGVGGGRPGQVRVGGSDAVIGEVVA
jgi:hypothetical protein